MLKMHNNYMGKYEWIFYPGAHARPSMNHQESQDLVYCYREADNNTVSYWYVYI